MLGEYARDLVNQQIAYGRCVGKHEGAEALEECLVLL
jgi:hypothetical protein